MSFCKTHCSWLHSLDTLTCTQASFSFFSFKLYLQLWRMLWLKLNPSMGRWCGRVHRMTLQPSRLTPTLSSSLCYLGMKSNGTSLRPCMWKQRDSGVGTSRTLSLRYLDPIGQRRAVGLRTFTCSYGRNCCDSWSHCIRQEKVLGAALFRCGQCHALGFAHNTVTPQNALCLLDRNDFDLEPVDGGQNGKIHWLPRHPCSRPAYRPQALFWQLCWPEYSAYCGRSQMQ